MRCSQNTWTQKRFSPTRVTSSARCWKPSFWERRVWVNLMIHAQTSDLIWDDLIVAFVHKRRRVTFTVHTTCIHTHTFTRTHTTYEAGFEWNSFPYCVSGADPDHLVTNCMGTFQFKESTFRSGSEFLDRHHRKWDWILSSPPKNLGLTAKMKRRSYQTLWVVCVHFQRGLKWLVSCR